jgi:hypothetical protein
MIPCLINLCTNSLMDALLQAIKGIVPTDSQRKQNCVFTRMQTKIQRRETEDEV